MQRASPLGPGRALTLPCGWNIAGARLLFDVVQIVLLGYVAVMTPFRLAFQVEDSPRHTTFWIEVSLDIYFLFDMYLNFNTPFFNEDGYLVTDRKEIRRIYMRSWFWIDALACFPSSEVEAAVDTFPKGLRALRLVKMLRLLRLQRVMSRHLEAAGAYLHHIKIATQISLWFFIAHLLGCAWYFAGHQVESGYSGQKIYGWVHHEDWPVLRLFPPCALIAHAQGSSGVVENTPV